MALSINTDLHTVKQIRSNQGIFQKSELEYPLFNYGGMGNSAFACKSPLCECLR